MRDGTGARSRRPQYDEAAGRLGLTYGLLAADAPPAPPAAAAKAAGKAPAAGTGGAAPAPAEKKGKGKGKGKGEGPPMEAALPARELLGSVNFPRGDARLGAAKDRKFYVTTAINYANGSPHMGHAYEALVTDVANTAAKEGKRPIELVDECVAKFKALDARLDVSYDDYLRTTSERHKACCRELWRRCSASGDVFLERYDGWYDERAECFVKASDAQLQNFCDADGIPLKRTSEECYFFKLGKYAPAIRAHVLANPHFVEPESRRKEVLLMLDDAEDIEKLSISRTTFDWGVGLPEGFDAGHVMYVWIDALTNYVTGAGGLAEKKAAGDPCLAAAGKWPADIHVIGKDIVRFHAIYWPAFLMSAGLPLPKSVFCHGFVLDAAGTKMSKTLGNVLDPNALLDAHGSDSFRYFCVKDASPGADVKFSETSLILAHNNELADAFGNLVHRATAFAQSKCGGRVPAPQAVEGLGRPFDLDALRAQLGEAMEKLDVAAYAQAAMAAARGCNKWVTDLEPWKMKDDLAAKRTETLRLLLEACYALALLLAPIVPRAATFALRRVGGAPAPRELPGEGDVKAALAKEKKAKGPASKKAPAPPPHKDHPSGEDDTAASRLALVVGKIVDVWPHPDSDKLFCEKIDCGEAFGGVREAKKLAGFPSNGMVLCATHGDDGPKFVEVPAGAKPGDRHFVTRGGVCFYKDKPFAVNGANCTAPVPDGAAIN
ncbi:hypothetical protein JL721_8900 [Aureococcus anophagefferens]|nr:hypothetical protein JL721_8900 [Aureococcus anophagefferens]